MCRASVGPRRWAPCRMPSKTETGRRTATPKPRAVLNPSALPREVRSFLYTAEVGELPIQANTNKRWYSRYKTYLRQSVPESNHSLRTHSLMLRLLKVPWVRTEQLACSVTCSAKKRTAFLVSQVICLVQMMFLNTRLREHTAFLRSK